MVPLEELWFPDCAPATTGAFGTLGLWNNAPHPNAAKVYLNWILSKEGQSIYAKADGQASVRADVDASAWLSPTLIPKKGQQYLDTYSYEFVTSTRSQVEKFFATMLAS